MHYRGEERKRVICVREETFTTLYKSNKKAEI